MSRLSNSNQSNQLTPPRSSAATSEPTAVVRRADLDTVETLHKHDSAIVVKDPISLKYHRLRPDEYFVLQLLDGKRSLADIREAYEHEFPPTRVTEAQLNQLLFRFHQNGLTLSNRSMQGDRLHERGRREKREKWMQAIGNVLFIRFPGVDPEPLLKILYPFVRPLFSRLSICLLMLACFSALVVFSGKWEQFASEFPRMEHWLRFESILILGGVIFATKVLHELGHAVVCKHFGGECHQIGPMLLVFTPALYCDTSDSWMLPSRWQRAAVGFAGIWTEIVLAALATFVWASTAPGTLHYVAMNVMLVCSVSTLMFNANPLLRYDGYYVLSDLCDVPNMGEKSRKLLASQSARIIFGVDEPDPDEPIGSARFWLTVYGVLAFVYRWGLTVLIIWLLANMLRPYGLESIGRLLCVFAAGGLLFTLLRNPIRFLKNPARRRLIRMKRVALTIAVIAAVTCCAYVPINSEVSGEARVVPRSETPVYVASSGQLNGLEVQLGEAIKKGQIIARLINHDTELQYIQAKGRFEKQDRIVEVIKSGQFENPEMANELPGAEAMRVELERQLETRRSRRDNLVIRAPCSGRLVAAPRRRDDRISKDDLETTLVSWSGYPTDVENENCFLETGTELLSIATSENWDAEIKLKQRQVERIMIGNQVKMVLNSDPTNVLLGTIVDVSKSEFNPLESGQRRDDQRVSQEISATNKVYVVRVKLNETDLPLTAGATATARLEAKPISIFGRIKRLANAVFRFR